MSTYNMFLWRNKKNIYLTRYPLLARPINYNFFSSVIILFSLMQALFWASQQFLPYGTSIQADQIFSVHEHNKLILSSPFEIHWLGSTVLDNLLKI